MPHAFEPIDPKIMNKKSIDRSVKICDQLERKTCHELNVGTGVVMVEAGGANGTVVAGLETNAFFSICCF